MVPQTWLNFTTIRPRLLYNLRLMLCLDSRPNKILPDTSRRARHFLSTVAARQHCCCTAKWIRWYRLRNLNYYKPNCRQQACQTNWSFIHMKDTDGQVRHLKTHIIKSNLFYRPM